MTPSAAMMDSQVNSVSNGLASASTNGSTTMNATAD
jgi:hypothetical protein